MLLFGIHKVKNRKINIKLKSAQENTQLRAVGSGSGDYITGSKVIRIWEIEDKMKLVWSFR